MLLSVHMTSWYGSIILPWLQADKFADQWNCRDFVHWFAVSTLLTGCCKNAKIHRIEGSLVSFPVMHESLGTRPCYKSFCNAVLSSTCKHIQTGFHWQEVQNETMKLLKVQTCSDSWVHTSECSCRRVPTTDLTSSLPTCNMHHIRWVEGRR